MTFCYTIIVVVVGVVAAVAHDGIYFVSDSDGSSKCRKNWHFIRRHGVCPWIQRDNVSPLQTTRAHYIAYHAHCIVC